MSNAVANLKRAVFLDKDGTLIQDVPYNVNPQMIKLMPGAVEGLRLMVACGYELLVVSNQSGVARGLFAEPALAPVEKQLQSLLNEIGVTLSGFYYCPHHPDGTVLQYAIDCDCRKPAPGLLLKAAREHGIDLTHSWFIGDILNDVEAGKRAGCRTILLDTANETEWEISPMRMPHYIAKDLAQAALIIQSFSGFNQTTTKVSDFVSGADKG